MKTILTILAALFAGVLLSHYMWPQSVLAQAPQGPAGPPQPPPSAYILQAEPQAQTPQPPQPPTTQAEIRAQRFTFVDDKNEVQATLSVDVDGQGRPTIVLSDRNGRKMWAAGGSLLRPLAMK